MTLITELDLNAFIVDQYDRHILAAGDQVTYAESREAILAAVMHEVEQAPRNVEAEARTLIHQVLDANRSNRTKLLKREIEWIVDAASDPDSSVGLDTILDHAFPLGRTDGADKSLRHWTRDDLLHASRTRFQVAAEQVASAADFDRAIQSALDLMDARGFARLGDLT